MYCDIDGVLCTNTDGDYPHAKPLPENIARLNALYDSGDTITLWTARGTKTGQDWRPLTEAQMKRWGVRYHVLQMGKPQFDVLIDDKARCAP